MSRIKYLPNLITLIRILISLYLLTVKPLSTHFFVLYFICGFSDFLDGYIARKTKSSSKLGANLDSLADFIFISVILFSIIPIISFPFMVLVWMAVIALIRLVSQIIGWLRFHQLAFLHTYANKATGLILFISPILLIILGTNISLIVISTIATVSAIEDLYLNTKAKVLDLNNKGLFFN